MDKQGLLNKISFIIQDLKSQHSRLTGNTGKISEMELELFITNARYLVDHLEVLKRHSADLNAVSVLPILADLKLPADQNRLNNENQVVPEPKPNILIINRPDQTVLPPQAREFPHIENRPRENKELKTIFPLGNKQGVFGPMLERRAAQISAAKARENNAKAAGNENPEQVRLSSSNSQIVNSLIPHAGLSASNINEQLANLQNGINLNGKLDRMSIREIRKAIGLNDHLLFIRTLFGGDPSAYDNTLTILDNLPNLESAEQYLHKEISGRFEWIERRHTAALFMAIITRKFNSE